MHFVIFQLFESILKHYVNQMLVFSLPKSHNIQTACNHKVRFLKRIHGHTMCIEYIGSSVAQ